MARSTEEIAQALRDAAGADRARVMADLFAEKIELRHAPPLPTDGPLPGAVLAETSLREVAAVEKALPERTETTEVGVEGDDVIRVVGRTTGRLADGREIDVRSEVRLTVADGRIVAMDAHLEPASLAAWGAVLMAGGFEIPEAFRPTQR